MKQLGEEVWGLIEKMSCMKRINKINKVSSGYKYRVACRVACRLGLSPRRGRRKLRDWNRVSPVDVPEKVNELLQERTHKVKFNGKLDVLTFTCIPFFMKSIQK
ncbi:uncharacterized protein LOC116774234 [Danaus plexippus]|uniref:uncharacterized protein LOC116774234 n=1 Tax=Danaus plexippus TaxID=13037 RepID=UPI002AAF5834|nr:uncharacterized protein LOC116774234 [Danaus plexippus]